MNFSPISVLKGPDRVRKRPAVFFGSDGVDGAVTAVISLLDIFVTEAALGFSKGIDVTVHANHSVSILSHDRGFLLDETIIDDKPAWYHDFCDMYCQPRESNDNSAFGANCNHIDLYGKATTSFDAYQVNSDRLLDLCWVQYASAFMHVQSIRNGVKKTLQFEKGYSVSDLKTELCSGNNGTMIHLLPDAEVFTDVNINSADLAAFLRDAAATISGLTCTVRDKRDNTTQTFCFQNGIKDLAEQSAPSLCSMLFENEIEAIGKDRYDRKEYRAKIKLVFGFCHDNGSVRCLHNYRKLPSGGTHVEALKTKLMRYINYERQNGDLSFDDIAEHVVIVLESNCSPRATDYQNEARTSIQNRMITDMTADLISKQFRYYLKQHRDDILRVLRAD